MGSNTLCDGCSHNTCCLHTRKQQNLEKHGQKLKILYKEKYGQNNKWWAEKIILYNETIGGPKHRKQTITFG